MNRTIVLRDIGNVGTGSSRLKWLLEVPKNLQLPVSPYQTMVGTVITGALGTGIKSDFPGDVIGTVMEPVYNRAIGKRLPIPQLTHPRLL